MTPGRDRPVLDAVLLGALALTLFHVVAALTDLGFWNQPRWDEGYYATIAARGYRFDAADQLHASNVVFSPGYPWLLRGLRAATGVHLHPLRLLLSGGLFLVAAGLAGALFAGVEPDRARRRRALALLFLAPGAFFAMVGYAEALAFPLALGFFLAWQRERRLLACALAAAALFTRTPAVVLPMTLALVTLLEVVGSQDVRAGLRRLVRLGVVELPLCSLGLVAYLVTLHFAVGDAFAFLDAYVAWNKLEPAEATLVPSFHPWFVLAGTGSHPTLWVALFCFLLTPALLIVARRDLPWRWVVYGGVAWLFFLANDNPYRLPLGNHVRWLATLFPLALALAHVTGRGRFGRAGAFWIVLALQVGVFVWLAQRFVRGEWVS